MLIQFRISYLDPKVSGWPTGSALGASNTLTTVTLLTGTVVPTTEGNMEISILKLILGHYTVLREI